MPDSMSCGTDKPQLTARLLREGVAAVADLEPVPQDNRAATTSRETTGGGFTVSSVEDDVGDDDLGAGADAWLTGPAAVAGHSVSVHWPALCWKVRPSARTKTLLR